MAKGGKVQDGKTTVTKKDPCLCIHPKTFVVRSAVNKRGGHPASNVLQFR
jgi:hypothetical protein